MSFPNRLDGGTPDGVPPFAEGGYRFWRGKVAAAVLVLVAAVSAGVANLPSSGLSLFQSEASAGALAQPYPSVVPSAAPQQTAVASTMPRPVAAAPTATATPALVCPVPSVKRRRGVPASWPIAIQIPSIGVDAAVELAGVDRHGDMQVPVNPCDVAWYKPGPAPGAAGDAVIDGHLDWWTDGPAVFWKLKNVRPGAEIDVIDAGGAKLRFKVAKLASLQQSKVPTELFNTTGPAVLTLYTCAGVWEPGAETYSQRLFVEALPVRSHS
jgi:hypothetical protein